MGYRLLARGNAAGAIAVFRLNVETHPRAANAYDSLAEAYAAVGDKRLAIADYRRALALDGNKKSSGIALAALTGVRRGAFSPIVLVHIGAGVVAIGFGALALGFRKGLGRHRFVGNVSSLAMLGVAVGGGYLGVVNAQASNVLAGCTTLYLVSTGWFAVRRRDVRVRAFEWVALVVAAALVGGYAVNAIEGARMGSGFAALFVVSGTVVFVAAMADVAVLVRGELAGPERIGRHLWRTSYALLIVTSSLFLGQSQAFPEIVRRTGVLAAPTVLILAAMLYWLRRVRGAKPLVRRPAV